MVKIIKLTAVCVIMLTLIQLMFEDTKQLEIKYAKLLEEKALIEQVIGGEGAGIKLDKSVTVEMSTGEVDGLITEHGLKKYVWMYSNLIYPVMSPNESYIRCEKGYRWFQGYVENHLGIDIVSKWDLRVVASHSGKVTIRYNRLYGNHIYINGTECVTKYSHLYQFRVKDGDIVKQGDVIGIMGRSGRSTGIHLDYEIWMNGLSYNPFASSTYGKNVRIN